MTYLGCPRLHFSGRFQADPSTVNNNPLNFDTARFMPRYQRLETAGNTRGGWNPSGTGAWRLAQCRITSLVYSDGASAASPAADVLVGGLVGDASTRVAAKLVDLDPDQQGVSQIWGLRLQVCDSTGRNVVAGEFEVTGLTDIWMRCPAVQGDATFSAFYQSVLTEVVWDEGVDSPFAAQLRAAAEEGLLSVKFNVDGFDPDASSPTFTWGRMVGSIGAYRSGEPRHFVAGRLLRQQGGTAVSLQQAICRIDENSRTLFVDLGNSLPTAKPGGPLLPDIGLLQVAVLPADGSPPQVLAAVEASTYFYESQAGILSAPLSAAQLKAAQSNPLGVVSGSGQAVYLQENAACTYMRADDFVFRLDPAAPPHGSGSTTIFATQYGKPWSKCAIDVWLDPTQEGYAGGPQIGVPTGAMRIPASITTGKDGTATLQFSATDPGNPRRYIDGQVYGIAYGPQHDESVAGGSAVSALVWSAYPMPATPTWVADVQPILQQYANLYPVMRNVLDLSDYHSVVQQRGGLSIVLGLLETDPNFMPVTRDLSWGKRAVLQKWLGDADPPAFVIDGVESLRQVLQLAIEIEHATLPTYLAAYFSIMPGRNVEVAEIIRSVVLQEMLHLALACNLLNAVGGAPSLDRPAFIPKFPGHLPAGVRPDLTVRLRRCSIAQVRDIFMAIEEPEETETEPNVQAAAVPQHIDTRSVSVARDGTPQIGDRAVVEALVRRITGTRHHRGTIGWFYTQVGRALIGFQQRKQDVYSGDAARQLTPADWPDAPGRLYKVSDLDSALLAIHEIVRQGEGTTLTDPLDDQGQPAHYFRFKEIVEGRRMIQKDGAWVFEGAPVHFDPDGVCPMVDDPDTAMLPAGSQVRMASQLCDQTYGDLLRALHLTVNGQPAQLGAAIGLMYSVEVLSRKLMTMPVTPGSSEVAGPSFLAG